MVLNSDRVMEPARCRPSGDCFHTSSSARHSASVLGGRPPCGRQSVMLSPDRVRRVTPPTATIPPTLPAVPSSQYPPAGGAAVPAAALWLRARTRAGTARSSVVRSIVC